MALCLLQLSLSAGLMLSIKEKTILHLLLLLSSTEYLLLLVISGFSSRLMKRTRRNYYCFLLPLRSLVGILFGVSLSKDSIKINTFETSISVCLCVYALAENIYKYFFFN